MRDLHGSNDTKNTFFSRLWNSTLRQKWLPLSLVASSYGVMVAAAASAYHRAAHGTMSAFKEQGYDLTTSGSFERLAAACGGLFINGDPALTSICGDPCSYHSYPDSDMTSLTMKLNYHVDFSHQSNALGSVAATGLLLIMLSMMALFSVEKIKNSTLKLLPMTAGIGLMGLYTFLIKLFAMDGWGSGYAQAAMCYFWCSKAVDQNPYQYALPLFPADNYGSYQQTYSDAVALTDNQVTLLIGCLSFFAVMLYLLPRKVEVQSERQSLLPVTNGVFAAGVKSPEDGEVASALVATAY